MKRVDEGTMGGMYQSLDAFNNVVPSDVWQNAISKHGLIAEQS